MKNTASLTLMVVCATALLSCRKPFQEEGWASKPITRAYTFPWRDISTGELVPEGRTAEPTELNQGREMYMHYCYACHGVNGDGNGPAAIGLRPPPRDFRIATFKFAAVKDGLPNDWDLYRIVQGGLHGSAMLEWDISDGELDKVLQFIKTFPPPPCEGEAACKAVAEKYPADKYPNGQPNPWEERQLKDQEQRAKNKLTLVKGTGVPVIVPDTDPWVGKVDEAIKTGKALYHVQAKCASCHPAYISRAELVELAVAAKLEPGFREDMYFPKVIFAKDNPYKVNIMPPDFTMMPVRSIRDRERNAPGSYVPVDPVRELWRLIASGVGGTGMPSWKDSIKDDEIWALSHYVKSLIDLRLPENRAKLKELRAELTNQRSSPPPPAPPPPPPPTEEDKEATKEEEKDPDAAKSAEPKEKDAPKEPKEKGKDAPKEAPKGPPKDAPKDAPKPAPPKAPPPPAAPK